MADKEFTLRIITPERVFYEGIVDMVEFNTTEGQIGVLPGHIPLTERRRQHCIPDSPRSFPKELPFWQRLSNGRMRSMKTVRRQHCTVRKRDCAARRRRRILPGQRRHCREQWREFRCCDKLRSTSFFFYAYAIKKHEAFGYGIKAFFYDTSGLSGKNG